MFPTEPADEVRSRFLPHLIKGDLDSLRADVLEFYTAHGVPIVNLSHDQMTTDLQKCLRYIETHLLIGRGGGGEGGESDGSAVNEKSEENGCRPPRTDSAQHIQRQVDTIVAIGAHGGRLDHILSNLSTLHTFRDVDIVLCGDGNLSRLVPAGKTVIKPHRKVEGPSCGLIPLQGRAVATSKGLRWNLEATEMEIGGLVSTSNIIDEDEVWVETDVDLIWTTELNEVH
jgi:thiamine pyrophosphokinase